MIPPQIGALSKLTHLNLSGNNLTGIIPPQLGNLTNLFALDLAANQLTGPIPPHIGNLTRLETLSLGGNRIVGPILPEIVILTRLETLSLRGNVIVGPIPADIAILNNLYSVDRGYNQINGTIPSRWNNVSSNLRYLSLDHNQLCGGIPIQLAKFNSIQMIDISGNSISGTIPSELGLVPNAHHRTIDLSDNSLVGGLPDSLSNLERVDLRINNLSGPIPQSMHHNYEEGNLGGNPNLYYPVSPMNRHGINFFHPIILVIGFACLFPCGLCLLLCHINGKKNSMMSNNAKEGDIFKIWNYDGKIAYDDIIEATAHFDLTYCIGTGRYGSVYRTKLPTGPIVAVKKLHKFEAENHTYDKCFRNEVEVLSGIRHRNIVKLFGYCLHNRCMFLIYDMERGSLFCVLSDAAEAVEAWSSIGSRE